ncbi:MAG: hypothetical protein HY584_02950 [Candidatus Omnitrophica bacterium]|nr:hypothetical protein [Candidatus Omnitrophota bacterium]
MGNKCSLKPAALQTYAAVYNEGMQIQVPIEWVQAALISVASCGIGLGVLSIALPKRSIQLYQWMMKNFNWRVEPIHYERELRNTRVLGFWLFVMSVLMLVALFKPEWVRAGWLGA